MSKKANSKANVFTIGELSAMEGALGKLNKITEPGMILKVLKASRPFMHAIKDVKQGTENLREEAMERFKPYKGREEEEEVQMKLREIEFEVNEKLRDFQKDSVKIDVEKLKYSEIKEYVDLDVNDLLLLEKIIDLEA